MKIWTSNGKSDIFWSILFLLLLNFLLIFWKSVLKIYCSENTQIFLQIRQIPDFIFIIKFVFVVKLEAAIYICPLGKSLSFQESMTNQVTNQVLKAKSSKNTFMRTNFSIKIYKRAKTRSKERNNRFPSIIILICSNFCWKSKGVYIISRKTFFVDFPQNFFSSFKSNYSGIFFVLLINRHTHCREQGFFCNILKEQFFRPHQPTLYIVLFN